MAKLEELKDLAHKTKEERDAEVEAIRERQRQQAQQKRRKKALLNAHRLEVMEDGAWVSEALASHILGKRRKECRHAVEDLGGDPRKIGAVPMLPGRHLAAACSGGMLGQRARSRLTATVVESLEDLPTERDPDDPNRTRPRQTIMDGVIGKPIRERLESKFEDACQALRERASDMQFDDQPKVCRSGGWAAKNGDPKQGPAESLEDCLPLEIGWTPSGKCSVRWIVRGD